LYIYLLMCSKGHHGVDWEFTLLDKAKLPSSKSADRTSDSDSATKDAIRFYTPLRTPILPILQKRFVEKVWMLFVVLADL
jgi:hypothetical protein